MDATDLVVWGLVIHLVCDWLLQSEWMALNKSQLLHPAGYVHAGIHGVAFLLIFPWWGALTIFVTHFLIDLRKPVAWWSKLMRQTQPDHRLGTLVDIGTNVRVWVDQVFHIGVIAIVALVASS